MQYIDSRLTSHLFRPHCISAQLSGAYPDENPSGESIIYVHWSSDDDKLNPANFSIARKAVLTAFVSLIGVCVTAASAIDAVGLPQYAAEFRTTEVVGGLTTGTRLFTRPDFGKQKEHLC